MNNSFIQGKDNLVQDAKFSEYVVFKVYYQSVIAWKIASYVAKEKIEKENVALEINTGASVIILNKTCVIICLPIYCQYCKNHRVIQKS